MKRIIHIRHLQDQSESFNAMVDFRMSFFKYAVWLNLSFYMYLVLLFSLLFFFFSEKLIATRRKKTSSKVKELR